MLILNSAEIAAWKAKGVFSNTLSTLAPIVLSDSSGALIGGTVRAVTHVTGGGGAGDDLLVDQQLPTGNGSAAPYQLAILKRAGSWSEAGTTKLFASGSPAITFIDLPSRDGDRWRSRRRPRVTDDVEAATFTYATAGGDLTGLLVSIVYFNGSNPNQTDSGQNEHDLRLFGGDAIAAGGTLAWSLGVSLPIPASLAVATSDIYGYSVAGGRDAIGDAHNDLLIADKDNGQVYAYDGAQLLGTQVPSSGPPAVIYYSAKGESDRRIGAGAELLADLDGDGKAEIAGAADPTAGAVPIYFWFSQTGDGGALQCCRASCAPLLPRFELHRHLDHLLLHSLPRPGAGDAGQPRHFIVRPGARQRAHLHRSWSDATWWYCRRRSTATERTVARLSSCVSTLIQDQETRWTSRTCPSRTARPGARTPSRR